VTEKASADGSPRALLSPNSDTVPPIVANQAEPERYWYLDALRGLAVVLMVEQHLGVWLTALHRLPPGLLRPVMGLNALGGAAAPLFIVLSGVGMALGSHLRSRALWQRALALAAVGYLLNLSCPVWLSPGSFYVLHLIAAFWFLAPAMRRLGDGWLLALFVLLLLSTALVQTWLETPPHLSIRRLADRSLPLWQLALAEGHFPVLPWLALATLGLWAGRRLKENRLRSLYSLAGVLLVLFATTRLSGLWLGAREARRLPVRALVQFSFYPATVAFVLCLGGIALLLLALAAGHQQGRAASEPSPTGLPTGLPIGLGRTSLTVLFVHVVLFCQGAALLGLERRVSPLLVACLLVGFLVAWELLARAWARVRYRYSLEWWIRRAGQLGRAVGRPQDLPR